jgi:hypothetical protein
MTLFGIYYETFPCVLGRHSKYYSVDLGRAQITYVRRPEVDSVLTH